MTAPITPSQGVDLVDRLRNLGMDNTGFRRIGVQAAEKIATLKARIEELTAALVTISDSDWEWSGRGSDVRNRGSCGKIAARVLGISEALPLGWPDPKNSETRASLASKGRIGSGK
jgi:hypothetical protein